MISKQRLIFFLVAVVIPFCKVSHRSLNYHGFDIWVHVYIINVWYSHFASTNNYFSRFLIWFILLDNFEVWIIHLRIVHNIFITRYKILEKVAVNFVAGITNLVGYPPFLLTVLWCLIKISGEGITHILSNCITNCYSWLDRSIFTLSINFFSSSNILISFGLRTKSSDFRWWSMTHRW